MNERSGPQPLRLAILQRVCTGYRKRLFQQIGAADDLVVRVFIGEDLPESKVRSTTDLSGLDVEKLPTRFVRLGGRIVCHHRGLTAALERFRPDVVLCEGESNALSYLKAIRYRRRYPAIGLIHWSLGGLPGAPVDPRRPRSRIKKQLLRSFDTFVTYSSFGKHALRALGVAEERIFPAINVCDTDYHLRADEELRTTRAEARRELGLPDCFTCLYVGAIDPAKRLDQLLHAAALLDPSRFSVVVVGDGPAKADLERLAAELTLGNISFPGRIQTGLTRYYRAADAFVLPGRGGMVISEAMAYALPVVVYRADGTEYDLVLDGETGVRLQRGDAPEIREVVEALADTPDARRAMGKRGQQLIRDRYNQAAMVQEITRAAVAARAAR